MSHFLSDTFRPYTEEEKQGIRRYHRQRAIVGLCALAVTLALLGLFSLGQLSRQHTYRGTWVAYDDHADGFHPGDRWLELRENDFYLNDNHYGRLKREGGRDFIPVQAPAGRYNRYLSVNGDVLTIEYELPATAMVYSSTAAAQTGFIDPASPALIQSILEQSKQDRRVVEMYVRISEECRLTQEQRTALY